MKTVVSILEIFFLERNSTVRVSIEDSAVFLTAKYLQESDIIAITKICDLTNCVFTTSSEDGLILFTIEERTDF